MFSQIKEYETVLGAGIMDNKETKAELKAALKELGVTTRGNPSEATLKKLLKKAQKTQTDLKSLDIDQSPSGVVGVPKGEDDPQPISNYVPLPEQKAERADALEGIGLVTPQEKPKPTFGGCSEKEIIEAVRNYAARGMTIKFLDNTWEFRMKDRIDSGTMIQPVYNIVKAAEAICRESVSANRMFLKA